MAKKKSGTSSASKTEMMDPSAPERAQGVAKVNHQRTAYAIEQFQSEVTDLFPETGTSIDNYNGRNVGLDLIIDASMMDNDDAILFYSLMGLVEDPRVAQVVKDEETEQVVVSVHNNPRTYDIRDTFSLREALLILGGGS